MNRVRLLAVAVVLLGITALRTHFVAAEEQFCYTYCMDSCMGSPLDFDRCHELCKNGGPC